MLSNTKYHLPNNLVKEQTPVASVRPLYLALGYILFNIDEVLATPLIAKIVILSCGIFE